ncbi:MAG: hypothetical protein IJ385_02505 [Ruminiclostridium sp.]|nr:hypothetical protein [Ruminiclostridium sp.]
MTRQKLKPLCKNLQNIRKKFRAMKKYRLEAETLTLISSVPVHSVLFKESRPLLVYLLEGEKNPDTARISELISPYAEKMSNSDFGSLSWQLRYTLIMRAACSQEDENAYFCAGDVDFDQINRRLNPLHLFLENDKAYRLSTPETQNVIRFKAGRIAAETGIPEERLSREYMKIAENTGESICETIWRDYLRVFPHKNPVLYIAALLTIAVVITFFAVLFSNWVTGLAVFTPAFGIAKVVVDRFLISREESSLSAMYTTEEAEKHTAVCALSVLADSPESIRDGISRLKQAKIRNNTENIRFCLLCDLPPSDKRECDSDEPILEAVRENDSGICVLVRHRDFSKTQNLYQGKERKRGAIDDLVRFIEGESVDFRIISGNSDSMRHAEFICALDYDTVPFMDTINSLIAVAIHPVNSGYGIITPRITTSLSSSARTGLSRLWSGNGGCSGASVYDNVDTELYSAGFGEGTFTGKGLIRVRDFYEKLTGAFPDEKILSHDILEGGILNVLYCGEIEFNDSFPPTTKGFFSRNHRWIRGDIQNLRFVDDKRFSILTKFKLSDNVRRAVQPVYSLATLFLSAFYGYYFPAAVALASLVLPYLTGLIPAAIRGFGFSNTREFHSPFLSLSRTLVSQLFGEIIFLAKNAVVSLDALTRTVYRIITGKKLLEWRTASVFDKVSAIGYGGFVIPEITALALFIVSVLYGNILTAIAALFMVFALPAAVCLDRVIESKPRRVKSSDKEKLLCEAGKLWLFFNDYVTEEEHFLPPDNVQYTPVYRVARRTSPTNIGMYLLSCVSAAELKIIDRETVQTCISRTIKTVGKMEKYKGNLYNWYSTEDLSVLGTFVSSVDSGNFLCCAVAVKEWLKETDGAEKLINEIESIIKNADLSVFYNHARDLFSTGIDSKTHALTPNCYDMLMSEARMLSYFAIASGQVPKKHWRALSRTMSRSGKYAGPVAWTGTMFEFFMPELLLDSKKGSLSYEALKYAVHCQRERGRKKRLPFGISESAYYSFDKELNYLYKAHGVQSLALCGGMNREYVISPYSTFLALSHSFNACMNNFTRLSQPEFSHSRYGCYEAIDLTPHRTGGTEAVVKSHMSHHAGMSISGIANALCDGKLRALFLSDETMARADELLEERIMSGEKIINIEKLRDRKQPTEQLEQASVFSLMRPEINIAANHKLAVFISDTGLYYGRYGNVSTMVKTPDYLRRPKGMFFGIADGETEIPFFLSMYDKGGELERSVVFGENTAEFYVNSTSLRNGMKLSLYGENAAEIREFAVENISGMAKNVSLTAYFEPCLMDDSAYNSHPAFADLFLKTEYDEAENVVIARRKSRDSDHEIYMCIGFKEPAQFNYSFSREDVNEYGEPLSFMEKAGRGENITKSVPSPCIFIDLPVKINAGGKFSTEMFVCYGESKSEVMGICHDIRAEKEEKPAVSPLPKTTLQGQIARKILASVIYHNVLSEEILSAGTNLRKSDLHRFGISGDVPLLFYCFDGDYLNLEGTILTVSGLTDCQLSTELVILCRNENEQRKISEILDGNSRNAVVIIENSLTEAEKNLLVRFSAFIFGKSEIKKPPAKLMEIVPCDLLKAGGNEGFADDGFVIDKKGHPWCNVLASRQFGCIVSQNSLGFTYAMNSRENKLTPWYNDTMHDNNGEMLLVKGNGEYYDIIAGARAVFAPNKADYFGAAKGLEFHTAVRVFQKGMGKELSVTIKNSGSLEKTCSLSYYTEPVLGADKSANGYGAGLEYYLDGDAVFVSGKGNSAYSGEMALYCDHETAKTTDREQFFAGHVNGGVKPRANGCLALTAKVKIPADKAVTIRFIMSFSRGKSREQLNAFEHVGTEWKKEMSPVIESDFPHLNKLYNYWLPWQTVGCRMWARSGFYQNGGAFGFRDQLQDSMAAVHFMPDEAKRQILNCCASQFQEGDVLHWWHKTNRGRKGVRTKCSDDMLWLPFVTAYYVKKTGDGNILSLNVQYIKGENLGTEHEKYMEVTGTDVRENVYLHCKKALEKGFQKGSKGLLQIGSGDWNDGYNRVGIDGRGESVWLSLFYVLTVKEFAPIARENGEDNYALELEKRAAELTTAVTENAYENGYFLRAFYDDGRKMGSWDSDCCKIDLLPQAFAVLADIPDSDKRDSALKAAYNALVDEEKRIIKLFSPAFTAEATDDDPGYVKSYPAGVRENGGQYTHGAIWLALAFLRNGDKATAKKLAEFLSPANRGEEYKNEPYFMSADIYTNPDAYGRGGWSLYTGSAGWYFLLLDEIYRSEQ